MNAKQIQYSSLSNNWKWLVRKMQKTNFGWLENIQFVDGEPQIGNKLHSVLDFRFGGENGPRPESKIKDFPVGEKIRELIQFSKQHGTFQMKKLQIKHGVPFRAEVENL